MRINSDMNFKSKQGIKGRVHLQLFGADGKLKEERLIENTITELMDAQVANLMSAGGAAAISYMSVGTGSGQTSASVGLAVSLDRNALDSTTQGVVGDDNDVIYVCTWAAGDGTGAITEAGILRLDDNTSMMTYAEFLVVNKLVGDSLVITWDVTFGAS